MADPVHVAVGIIRNESREVLVAYRDESRHQGGRWEFPGGRVEKNEQVLEALKRELLEEINLEVFSASPMMEIDHDYGDKQVRLDVWHVDSFEGEIRGAEDQQLLWVDRRDLHKLRFPEANLPIVEFLQDYL